jgi:hypothetical protein
LPLELAIRHWYLLIILADFGVIIGQRKEGRGNRKQGSGLWEQVYDSDQGCPDPILDLRYDGYLRLSSA